LAGRLRYSHGRRGTKGFFPVRIRWVVERSDAWHGRCRRISIGHKRRIDSRETMIQVSHIGIMLRRAGSGKLQKFNYRAK